MMEWYFMADGPGGQRREVSGSGDTPEIAFRPWAAQGWYWWRIYANNGRLVAWR